LKYPSSPGTNSDSPELFTVKLRYKQPDGETSQLLTLPFISSSNPGEARSTDLKFVTAVAAFGMLLRDSEHKGDATFDLVLRLAGEGKDGSAYRNEFIELVETAKVLKKRSGANADVPDINTPNRQASR